MVAAPSKDHLKLKVGGSRGIRPQDNCLNQIKIYASWGLSDGKKKMLVLQEWKKEAEENEEVLFVENFFGWKKKILLHVIHTRHVAVKPPEMLNSCHIQVFCSHLLSLYFLLCRHIWQQISQNWNFFFNPFFLIFFFFNSKWVSLK